MVWFVEVVFPLTLYDGIGETTPAKARPFLLFCQFCVDLYLLIPFPAPSQKRVVSLSHIRIPSLFNTPFLFYSTAPNTDSECQSFYKMKPFSGNILTVSMSYALAT